MAVANIQITQGVVVGVAGQSVIGLDTTTAITLTDAGGLGATSYLWEFISFPGPDAAAPTITNDTSQVATVTPSPSLTDGVYLLRLTRTDPVDGVSTQVRFFAVGDEDGIALPSAGMNRNNSNIGGSALAQFAGWFGSLVGGSNVFLDAFLRLRRKREGRFVGRSRTVSHAAGTPVTDVLTYGTSRSTQILNATGAGEYTIDLSTVGAEDGATFRLHILSTTGAGNVVIRNGVGGSTLHTVIAPGSGTIELGIQAYYDGTNWRIWPFSVVSPVDVAISAGPGTTTLGTYPLSGAAGGRPSTFRGVVHVWEATGATQKWSFEVTFRPDGATGAMVGTATIDGPEGTALGTLTIDSVGGMRFRFTAVDTVNAKTGRVALTEIR